MRMHKLALLIAVAILPVVYGAGDHTGGTAASLVPPLAQGLSLTKSQPDAIKGWFRKDDRAIQFAMTRDETPSHYW